MNEVILSYAAGTIDSDGCIQIMQRRSENKNYYSLRVSVTQVTECIPLWLVSNFGGRIDRYTWKKRRQPLCRWSIDSWGASKFLESIIPYLIEKIERAKLGIKLQSTLIYKGFADKLTSETIEERKIMYEQMKALNAKHSREYWKNKNYKEDKMSNSIVSKEGG